MGSFLLTLKGNPQLYWGKAIDGSKVSLNKLIDGKKYEDIKYGIKFGYKNIGFNDKFYTFPYFVAFLLKRYLRKKEDNLK